MSNPILLCTCLVYFTNAGTCLLFKQYTYSYAFMFLVFTSLLFHSNSIIMYNAIDKLAIFTIVYLGSNKYMNIINTQTIIENPAGYLLPPITFFCSFYLFGYGYITNQYCFDSVYGNRYHAYLHLLSSIGHHCLLL
jgi:hypothetical protein